MRLDQAKYFIPLAEHSGFTDVTLGATPAQDDFCVFGQHDGHLHICRVFEQCPMMVHPSADEQTAYQPLPEKLSCV